jgi:hypothetical protein
MGLLATNTYLRAARFSPALAIFRQNDTPN